MKLKAVVIAISLLFSSLFLPISAFAFENGDLQIWNTNRIDWKMNDRLKAKIEQELRFGRDVNVFYYTHTDGGLTFTVNDYLDLGGFYRQIWEKSSGRGKWKEENRPHADATLKWGWLDFKFKNRGRLELRVCEGKREDKWRFRNKLSLDSPWKWTDFNIQPYAADEIFLDFHGDGLTRNRLYGGLKAKIIKHLKAEVFYLWQTSEVIERKWSNINVIGIKAKVVF